MYTLYTAYKYLVTTRALVSVANSHLGLDEGFILCRDEVLLLAAADCSPDMVVGK